MKNEMHHRIRMICAARYFEITSPFKAKYLEFTNDSSKIARLLDSEGLQSKIGSFRTKTLTGAKCVGILQGGFIQLSTDRHLNDSITPTAINQLNFLRDFFNYLWFIKDCSCHFSELIVYGEDTESGLLLAAPEQYSMADGTFEDQVFSKDEIDRVFSIIKSAATLFNSSAPINLPAALPKGPGIFTTPASLNKSYKYTTRIERALGFLKIARSTLVLPLKIGMYVALLEALFSGKNDMEISHKLTERVTLYLGESTEDRLSIWKSVKSAYNIRSKFLHGVTMEEANNPLKDHNTLEGQIQVSKNIDEIVRRIMNKVIADKSGLFIKVDQDEYFKNLICTS